MRYLTLLTVLLTLGGCGRAGPPYSPKEALQTFKLEPGFRIEPYIAEPDIRSPVAMEFDENGRIYVVETKSSGIIVGVLGAQTPTTITIRHEGAAEDVIRREDIIDMRITELSGMPADVDKLVSIDEMADLLEFLKTGP